MCWNGWYYQSSDYCGNNYWLHPNNSGLHGNYKQHCQRSWSCLFYNCNSGNSKFIHHLCFVIVLKKPDRISYTYTSVETFNFCFFCLNVDHAWISGSIIFRRRIGHNLNLVNSGCRKIFLVEVTVTDCNALSIVCSKIVLNFSSGTTSMIFCVFVIYRGHHQFILSFCNIFKWKLSVAVWNGRTDYYILRHL